MPQGIESTFLRTPDGKSIEVWTHNVNQGNFAKTVIIFHGNADTLNSIYPIQKWLGDLGFNSYSFNYRGYGKSTGWPSDAGLYADAKTIWHYLNTNRNISPENTILFSSSLGAGPASWLAKEINPKGLIMLAPFRSIKKIMESSIYLKYLTPFLWNEFPVLEHLKQVTPPTCFAIAHGKKDLIISYSESTSIAAEIPGSIKFFSYETAGHNNLFSKAKKDLGKYLSNCFGRSY